MAGPASIFVLNLRDGLAGLAVPLQPLVASLRKQRFADVHITQELFAAIIAKAFEKLLVADIRGDLLQRHCVGLLGIGDFLQLTSRAVFGLSVSRRTDRKS